MYAPAAKAGVRRGEFNRPTGALKTPNAATSMQAVTMQSTSTQYRRGERTSSAEDYSERASRHGLTLGASLASTHYAPRTQHHRHRKIRCLAEVQSNNSGSKPFWWRASSSVRFGRLFMAAGLYARASGEKCSDPNHTVVRALRTSAMPRILRRGRPAASGRP